MGSQRKRDNVAVVRDFIEAWSRLDPEELAAYFHEDGTYHNMPAEPVTGRDAIQAFIAGFTGPWRRTDWEILNIVADGDVVIAERVDRTELESSRVDLPCVGVFEMRDGLIGTWRDYFDLGTYLKALEP